jgi:molecular chaperone GrpE
MALDDFTPPESASEIVEEDAELIDEDIKLENAEFTDVSVEQQILLNMDNIIAGVTALNQIIKERLVYDRAKEEAFDRLYVEVEEVRQERGFQQIRPLLMDLILLYDRIELGMQQLYGLEGSMPEVVQLLQSFRDELLEILYRREVEAIVVPTATFDRTLQQAVSVQPTVVLSEHNQVVRVVRRGFRYRNRILRSEEVIVSSYKAN